MHLVRTAADKEIKRSMPHGSCAKISPGRDPAYRVGIFFRAQKPQYNTVNPKDNNTLGSDDMVLQARPSKRRQVNGSGGRRKARPPAPPRPSPVSSVSKVGALNRYPDMEAARELLMDALKLVAPVINAHKFKVGTLCEMFPKNPNLLGLNVNRGQKILVRLRYHSNDTQFYPIGDIVGILLHELTHNVHGPHDNKFYTLLDQLKTEFDQSQYKSATAGGYRCEEQRLGRSTLETRYMSLREKRLKAFADLPKLKQETRVLGGITTTLHKNADPKKLALEAAERRLQDSKWCCASLEAQGQAPDEQNVETIDLTHESDDEKVVPKLNMRDLKEVVDLTREEYDEFDAGSPIVVIDACEVGLRSILKNPTERRLRRNRNRHVQFLIPLQVLLYLPRDAIVTLEAPPDDRILYTTSKLTRAYFADEKMIYPRRKVVASLDFEQILKRSEENEAMSAHKTKSSKPKKSEAALTKPKEKRKKTKQTRAKTGRQRSSNKKNKKVVKDIAFSDLV